MLSIRVARQRLISSVELNLLGLNLYTCQPAMGFGRYHNLRRDNIICVSPQRRIFLGSAPKERTAKNIQGL